MHDAQPITPNSKMSGQNCRLKASMSDFKVAGIVNKQTTNATPFVLAAIDHKHTSNRLDLPKFQSSNSLMGLRIKGLSLQNTTYKLT